MSDANIKNLKNKLKKIKSDITRHETAVKDYKEGDEVGPFEARLADVTDLFKQFDEAQFNLEVLQSEEENADVNALEAANNQIRTKVEKQYYFIVGKIKSILRNCPAAIPQQSLASSTQGSGNNRSVTNLKPLPLPTFSGKPSEWYNFYDLFKSLVDDDPNLCDIRKFHYLRSCLKDEALRAIEPLLVSQSNYSSALELLKRRFENKGLIVYEHVTNILNVPKLQKTSFAELRQLLDVVNNNLAGLKIHCETENWDPLLVPIICEKLDFFTRKEWQNTISREIPRFDTLIEFLEKRCQVLETMNYVKPTTSNSLQTKPITSVTKNNNNVSVQRKNPVKFTTNVVTKPLCYNCKESHKINQCPKFLNMTVSDRIKLANELKLCANCLRNNHVVNDCKSPTNCKECNQNHHSLLHITEFIPPVVSTLHITSKEQRVMLSSVLVQISDKNGNTHKCRALLDQCSEVNLITEELLSKLKLSKSKINCSIVGVNDGDNVITQSVNVKITSRFNGYCKNFDCLVINKISRATPAISFDKSLIQVPSHINLGDPEFNVSQEVHLLIGAQLYWELIIGSPIQFNQNDPFFQNTRLGWILGGTYSLPKKGDNFSCNTITINYDERELNKNICKFWEREEIPLQEIWTPEQIQCEEHFKNNTSRTPEGRFIVKLPFKTNIKFHAGNTKRNAIKQFYSLESRLSKDPILKLQYCEFIKEYLELDHMERVPFHELGNSSFYLPHHPVFKQTIHGSQIRVVFNASAKTDNESLNDALMTGPTIQQDLFSILCRFRVFQFVLSADITKMYRMILVHPDDKDFQRIVWRDNPNKPLEVYRLSTVTYGTTCAPYLAVRCLQQLASEAEKTYPTASQVITRDFYMDDVLTGADTLNEAIELREQLTDILSSGGFSLCKWTSNNLQLLPDRTTDNISAVNLSKDGDIKILGFFWNCHADQFKYNVDMEFLKPTKPATKRNILSTMARIFDPLGLINPVIVTIKILIQRLWKVKLDWDTPIPCEFQTLWSRFLNELSSLNEYRIPRKMVPNHCVTVEIHGYADASTKAYGAALYLRTIDKFGRINVCLICAKSKVAPIESVTLPRLELKAACLLAVLTCKVEKILGLHLKGVVYWSDSTIVLHWLNQSPENWKPFVAHRVQKIQSLSKPSNWKHVRSGDNPADIVSRGTFPKQLQELKLWWNGPKWLSQEEQFWPSGSDSLELKDERLLEKKATYPVNVITNQEEPPFLHKFSSFDKLLRVFAYVQRFIHNSKHKNARKGDVLSVEELQSAHSSIIKIIQAFKFREEITLLKHSSNRKNKLSKLDPFIDSRGILRVGGRLKHAPIPFDNKFPILLPAKHHVTYLIVRQTHETELHAGTEATLAAVRQKYWPIAGRNLVRKIVNTCVRCRRVDPKLIHTKMGDLPKVRLQPTRPFYVSGVDYAGPFLIKEGRTRNAKKGKAYVALFVCFATKAVHLELVGTTENFIACLKRFVSRRGNVAELFCDNGTNFVGAERALLQSLNFQQDIKNKFNIKGTKFNFIPAKSPHFGGLWERSVKSMKHHLKKVIGDASLNFEEFCTILTCVEACMNSRPITPISSNPNDLEALTPGHFLVGEALTAPVEPDLTSIPYTRLSRWQKVTQIQQQLWKRWQREYISQLQARPKGQERPGEDINVGTLVVLVEENLPPTRWVLGRVVEVHPGADGIIRVVSVKTENGVFKRAVKKLCVLLSAGI